MNFERLDALVEATDNEQLPQAELLVVQQKLAAERYRMAEVVAQLSKKAMLAETDRKALLAKSKLTVRAAHIGNRPLSNDAAVDAAEQQPEVIRARAQEIMSAADHEAAKLKYGASGDVLSSLSMRLAHLRDENKNTRITQQP